MKEIDEVISLLETNDLSAQRSDIEQIKRAFLELRNIKFALDQSAIVAITDRKGVITYVNDKFCEISKYSREELVGQTHRIINSGYHSREYFKEMWKTIGAGKIWEGQFKNKAKDGSYYWVETTIVPFLGPDGKPEKYISIRTDITAQKRVEEQVRQMALYDELTGLANRRLFKQTLSQCIEEQSPMDLAVVFLDLNRFSVINDTLGHEAGDRILTEVGKRLQEWEMNHSSVLASRYGGDEFVLLFTKRNEDQLKADLEQIHALIADTYTIELEEFRLSASMGVALYPQDGHTAEELIRHADMAMYHAKANDMGSIFYYQDYKHQLTREMQIERSLHGVVDEENYEIVYQPKVNVETEMMKGTEALLRWKHPTLGFVSPGEFIPIAERSGTIVSIGTWVLEQALKQNAKWCRQAGRPLIIAVNVSPIQLKQRNFVPLVKELLEESGMPPELLELEITENLAMQNEKEVVRKLKALQAIGVKISIDDFGTGYSSLKYLQRYGMNTLKIDRAFIRDYSKEREAESLIPGIIAIGHASGMKIVAEGVETREQLEFLKREGCDTVQGYVYSRPVPPKEIERMFHQPLVARDAS